MKRLIYTLLLLFPMALSAQVDMIRFSHQGGFYETSFNLSMYCSEGNHIRYTTNGSTPTASSTLYDSPLFLNASMYSKSNIYTVVNCPSSVYHPVDDVERAVVIRAAVFDANEHRISSVVTNSYFIKSLGCDLHGLPVLSIVTDSLALFDYETGIFIPGASYNPADSLTTGNYWNKGREWEREVNVEFYEPDNHGVNQACGLRIHGGASRWFQQKGMRLYAREEYGKKRFTHRFFETTPMASFKHLNLHPFRCSNWLQTGGQDYLSQSLAADLDIDGLAVRQTVVFINGEYWGIYTLEESADERYLEDHYEVSLDEVNILKFWGVPQYGDPEEWREIYRFLGTADLSQPEDSAYVYSHIDVPSFIDYVLFETFSANLDWPLNNVRIWQPVTGQPFRCIFYDGDGCFSWYWFEAMDHILNNTVDLRVLNRFLEHDYFCAALYHRYLQLKSSVLSYSNMKQVLEHYRHIVEGEIEKQSERFHFPYDKEKWLADMDKADEFLRLRYSYYEAEWGWTGLNEDIARLSLSCYPNPTEGRFNLCVVSLTHCESSVEMFDVMGRKVYAMPVSLQEGENRFVLDEGLPLGLYLVRVGATSQRIVIK